MIVGIDNDKLEFIATDDGQLVVTLRNLTEAIADREEFLNACVTHCKDCKHYADECCDRYADETLGYVHSTQEYGYCWAAERKG